MSNIVTPHEGAKYFFGDILVGDTAVCNLTLRLFDNDVTPNDNDVFATYNECTQAGYSAKTLTRGSTYWDIIEGSGSDETYWQYKTEQSFAFTGGSGTNYGYYITCNVGGNNRVVHAQRHDQPQAIFDGATIKVTPKIRLGTQID